MKPHDPRFLAWAKEEHLKCCDERLSHKQDRVDFTTYLTRYIDYLTEKFKKRNND